MVDHHTVKLSIELIPSNSYGNNLRGLLRGCTWDRLRKATYEEADHQCEICGSNGLAQGRKHRVEAHEVWSYDDENRIQTLERLQALCPLCHQAKHIGRSLSVGAGARTVRHLAKVNRLTKEVAEDYINRSLEEHTLRSHGDAWLLNISHLLTHPALTDADIRDLPYNVDGVFISHPISGDNEHTTEE